MLFARSYEAFPLTGLYCAGKMRIIAFVTDTASVQKILAHIGAPRPAPVCDPPTWASDIDGGEAMDVQAEAAGIDPLAQPEPDSIFDQRIAWRHAAFGADGTGLSRASAGARLGRFRPR